MTDADVNALIKTAAEQLGRELGAGFHVAVVVRAPGGQLGAYAESPDINTHVDLAAELQRAVYYMVAREAVARNKATTASGGNAEAGQQSNPKSPPE